MTEGILEIPAARRFAIEIEEDDLVRNTFSDKRTNQLSGVARNPALSAYHPPGIDADTPLASNVESHDRHGWHAAARDDDLHARFDAANELREVCTCPGNRDELHDAIVKGSDARFKGYAR